MKTLILILSAVNLLSVPQSTFANNLQNNAIAGITIEAKNAILDADSEAKLADYQIRMEHPLFIGDLISNNPEEKEPKPELHSHIHAGEVILETNNESK